MFVCICVLVVVFFWFFFCFVMMGKCVFNGKWKVDEKFKVWIVVDFMLKIKVMCVVCNKVIDILSMGEVVL